jgi:hypothetical protein
MDFLARAPKLEVALGIAKILHMLPYRRPMNIHSPAGDIAKNPFVCRGLAAHVVMLGQSVHGNGHGNTRERGPFGGNRNYAARDHHGVDAALAQDRQQLAQLAMAHHRLAAHQTQLHGIVPSTSLKMP